MTVVVEHLLTPKYKTMGCKYTLTYSQPNCNCGLDKAQMGSRHVPLTRYVKLRVAHAPGIPGTFSPPLISKETASYRSRHASRHVRHARAVVHVGIATLQWQGRRSRHSRRMRNPHFYVPGKRPMDESLHLTENCAMQLCIRILIVEARLIE